jgi:hypothetical protein
MPLHPVLTRMTFVLLFFQASICYGQTSSGAPVFHSNDFNWTITIPEGFEKVPDSIWMQMQNRGASAIESTYDTKVDNQAKTIFVFRSDQFHYFEANYQPYDPSKDGDYDKQFKDVNDVIYGTIAANMPQAKVDTAYGREVVGGKDFHVFRMSAGITPQMTLHILMYSRVFEKKEFTVNIMYVDVEKGKTMLEAWRASSFGAAPGN